MVLKVCGNHVRIPQKHRINNRTEKQNPIREPDLLMILTGGKFATRRADGVHVVPIGCLRP